MCTHLPVVVVGTGDDPAVVIVVATDAVDIVKDKLKLKIDTLSTQPNIQSKTVEFGYYELVTTTKLHVSTVQNTNCTIARYKWCERQRSIENSKYSRIHRTY